MILCDFCEDRAAYAHLTTVGIMWTAYPDRLNYCRYHLTLYYLGLTMVGGGTDD